jgi:hypothetical protein
MLYQARKVMVWNSLRLEDAKEMGDMSSLSRVEFVRLPTPVMLRSGLTNTPVVDC